jgi:hypothetical protein
MGPENYDNDLDREASAVDFLTARTGLCTSPVKVIIETKRYSVNNNESVHHDHRESHNRSGPALWTKIVFRY